MQNRRDFSRIPVQDEMCSLTINGHTFQAQLIDRSIGGFRVNGLSLLMLPNNVPIVLEHHGESTKVVCRSVTRIGENQFSLGLQRADLHIQRDNADTVTTVSPQIFINSYVKLDEHLRALCWPLALEESKLVIEVAGGREFKVDLNKIRTFTRSERKADLGKAECLKRLAELYTGTTGKQINPDAESITEFEFGPDNRLLASAESASSV